MMPMIAHIRSLRSCCHVWVVVDKFLVNYGQVNRNVTHGYKYKLDSAIV